jgi:hypothetical protein
VDAKRNISLVDLKAREIEDAEREKQQLQASLEELRGVLEMMR